MLLLYVSWLVCLAHGFYNNETGHRVHWFLLKVYKPNGELFTQDVQFYIHDLGYILSTVLIILSLIIIDKKTVCYRWALFGTFILGIIDLIHYILCYGQNQVVLLLQALIMVAISTKILIYKWTKL